MSGVASASATGASVASVVVGERPVPPHHQHKIARDEERRRVDWFIEQEGRIIEEGPENHEVRMEANRLRRFGPGKPVPEGVGGIGSAMEDTVIVAVPPPVVAAVPPPVFAVVPPPRAVPFPPPYHVIPLSKLYVCMIDVFF